jgi:16S rRNA G527 N7-methylase RsmG
MPRQGSPWEALTAGIEGLGAEVDAGFTAAARVFVEELGRWSRVSRLTGYRSEAERVVHLVLDSLFLLVIPEPAAPCWTSAADPGCQA